MHSHYKYFYFYLNPGPKRKKIKDYRTKKKKIISWLDQSQTCFYLDDKKFQYIICSRKKSSDLQILKSVIDRLGNQQYVFYSKIKWELFHLLTNLAFDK